jgi:restriction system protein
MFKEPKEPVFKLKQSSMVFKSFLFGLIMIIFLYNDIFFLILGITLFAMSLLIISYEGYVYKNKLTSYYKRVQKIKDSHIQEVDAFSGEKFEFYLKKLFEDLGYLKIQTTQKTRDFGVDLIMYDIQGKKIVIQAKRYKGTVGIDAINEAVGTRLPEEADEVWVVTNSYFTKPAIQHANKNRVKLINRDQLIDLILNSSKRLK